MAQLRKSNTLSKSKHSSPSKASAKTRASLKTKAAAKSKASSKTQPSAKSKASSRDKVRAHRQRLQEQGLRPVQFWLPDINSPEFIAEAHRTSLLVAQSPTEADDQAFLDSLAVWDED